MANADKEFDGYFRKKLINHEVKPSALAWEKLENKLSTPKKKSGFPFMSIAASLILLLFSGYLFQYIGERNISKTTELAETAQPQTAKTPQLVEKPNSPETINAEPREAEIVKNKKADPVIKNIPKNETTPGNSFSASAHMITEAEPSKEKTTAPEITISEISLPELDIQETIALNSPIADQLATDDEESYTIKIISRGLANEPEKEGLIGEIENKIDKIGGLLNKVDQGFADLQDAKNNLFATLTTKKERSK